MQLFNTSTCHPILPAFRPGEPLPAERAWRPAFDIVETGEAFTLRGDIPGLAPEDFEVKVEQGILALRGERKLEEHEANGRYERAYGKFVRRFRLPEGIDAEGIQAKYEYGVLELTLPKTEPAGVRLIPVQ